MSDEIKAPIASAGSGVRRTSRFASMPLAFKTQSIVGAALLTLFTVAAIISLVTLRRSFFRFETTDINNQLERATLLVEQQLNSLGRFCRDYAQWDDTVDFMDGNRPDYVSSNITPDTFNNVDIDAFILIRSDGTVYHHSMRPDKIPGREKDIRATREDGLGDVPPGLLKEIASNKKLLKLVGKEESTSGLLATKNGLLLVGASPVLLTNGGGSARGVLVMVRMLDPKRIEKYTTEIQVDFSVEKLPGDADADFNADPVVKISGENIESSKYLPGLLRDGAFVIKVSSHRHLLAQLRTSETLLLINMLLMCAACVVLVGLALHKVVLKRVEDFSKRANRIRQSPSEALRMPLGGMDELDDLARAINELLDELKDTEARLSYGATHDPLTDLGNRNFLMSRLEVAHALLQRDQSYEFAMFLINLDSFKNINDGYGHHAGDELLREMARRIKDIAVKEDIVARLSGDEFVILKMDVHGAEQCDLAAQNIVDAIARPFKWDTHTIDMTASVGVFYSISRCADCSPSEYLRDADIAMHSAKREGRNRHKYFACGQREQVEEKLSLGQELKSAAEKGELEVWYQPIISTASGRVECMEALVRWRHPERGLLGPALFVPLAEESNLVVALDTWMLYSSLQGLSRLRKYQPDLRISVNFSVRQMSHPDIIDTVVDALMKAALPADALCVELTETAIAQDEETLFEPMRKLMQMGIRIYLDDFGAGYSSLGRLNHLPVNVIKIDREFVNRIDQGDSQIVKAVVDMARALGKKVVAEGVETKTQTDALIALGCDYLQGFRFSHPLPEADISRYIRKHVPWQISSSYEDE